MITAQQGRVTKCGVAKHSAAVKGFRVCSDQKLIQAQMRNGSKMFLAALGHAVSCRFPAASVWAHIMGLVHHTCHQAVVMLSRPTQEPQLGHEAVCVSELGAPCGANPRCKKVYALAEK